MHAQLFRCALAAAVITALAAPAYVRAGPPVSPVRYPRAATRRYGHRGGRGASASVPPGTRTHPVVRTGSPASWPTTA
jgi:hypothetical protein